MVMAAFCQLELFRLKDEWGEPHMLDHTHDDASRNPCQNCGEQNSPDQDFGTAGLVAGEADGVACVVRGVVKARILCKAHAENHE
jgi:hypothetical protein